MKEKIINYCNNIIKVALPIILVSIPFSNALVNISISCATLALIIKKIVERSFRIGIQTLNLPIIFLLLIICLSVINSAYLKSSIIGLQKWFKYAFIYIFIIDIVKEKKYLQNLIFIFILSACLVSVDAIIQYVFGKDILFGYQLNVTPFENFQIKRVTGPLRNANDLSVYLVTVIPIAICVALYSNDIRKKVLFGIISALLGVSLFLTFFRGALLAFCAAIFMVSIIKKDKRIFILLVILLILSPFVLPKGAVHWLIKNPSIFNFFIDGSRLLHMKTALNMIKTHPFIGVGVNAFVPNYINYRPEGDNFVGWYAHNSFLQMAAEIGIIGLVIFIWLLMMFIINWKELYNKQNDDYIKSVSLGLFLGTLAFLIAGLLESNLYYSRQAVLFWSIFSLTMSIQNLKN